MQINKGFTPHGPGFRFVDGFEKVDSKPQGNATFCLRPDLWFFKDHFPGNPIMPAALLMESAAQAAGILWSQLSGEAEAGSGAPLFVAAVDHLRVLGPALPGDTLRTCVELSKEFGSLAQFQFEIVTDTAAVMRGSLTLSRELKKRQ